MATYKVIQDIEAEDKFLGPLTLKQFIFGAAGAFFSYLSFFATIKGAPFLMIIFLPPALLGFFLAIPWSSEQPTEVWVLAKLRFKFKPRSRVWDQAGLEELVTITAPKKIEKPLTNGLQPDEVESRLKALAATIDTRGWAVKNATLDESYSYQLPQQQPVTTDRLIDISTMPQQVPEIDTSQYVDVLDEDASIAESFDSMIKASSKSQRQKSLEKMDRIRHGESIESVQQPEQHIVPPINNSAAGLLDEQLIANELRSKSSARNMANSHLRTIGMPTQQASTGMPDPSGSSMPPGAVPQATDQATVQAAQTDQPQAQAGMTNAPDPAILNLAQNNDLNIETLARQAKKNDQEENEVVISLR